VGGSHKYHPSMVDADELLPLIERYCQRAGISPRTFGTRCMHDSTFVMSLHRGRMVRSTTVDRIRNWIAKRDSLAAMPPLNQRCDTPKNVAMRKDTKPRAGDLAADRSRRNAAKDGSDRLKFACLAYFAREAKRLHVDMPTAGAMLLNPSRQA